MKAGKQAMSYIKLLEVLKSWDDNPGSNPSRQEQKDRDNQQLI